MKSSFSKIKIITSIVNFTLQISWTHALRKIVINCYKYHGREDLLPTFADDDDKVGQLICQNGDDEEEDEEEMQHSTTTSALPTVSNVGTNTGNVGGLLFLVIVTYFTTILK